MEKLIETTGSSGYGFPFSLKHMNFYLACLEAKNGLAGLSGKIVSEKAKEYVKSIMDHVAAITDNDTISATGRNLGSVNALLQYMRRAFKMPRMGNLSDEIRDDDSIHDRCSLIIEHMEVFFMQAYPVVSGQPPELSWRGTAGGRQCFLATTLNVPFRGQTTAWRDSSGR